MTGAPHEAVLNPPREGTTHPAGLAVAADQDPRHETKTRNSGPDALDPGAVPDRGLPGGNESPAPQDPDHTPGLEIGKRDPTLGVGPGAVLAAEEGPVPVIETEDEGDPGLVAGLIPDPERGGPIPGACPVPVTGAGGRDPGTEKGVTGLVPAPEAEIATASLSRPPQLYYGAGNRLLPTI